MDNQKKEETRFKSEVNPDQEVATKRFAKVKLLQRQKLNVRQAATLNSKVVGFVCNDEKVEIISGNPSTAFYKIKTKRDLEGWCVSKFLELI